MMASAPLITVPLRIAGDWRATSAVHADGSLASSGLRLIETHYEDTKRAAALGRRYLETVPREGDVGQLVDAIFVGWSRRDLDASERDPVRFAQQIDAQQRRDFEQGHIEVVDGWSLSQTELRMFAVVFLSQRSGRES
jgi:hypothetical protein